MRQAPALKARDVPVAPRLALTALLLGLTALVLGLAVAGCGGHSHRSTSVRHSPTSTDTVTTPPTSTGPRPPVTRVMNFGADVGQIFLSRAFDAAATDRELAAAAGAGLGLVRAPPLWEFTEPSPPVGGQHRYDWRFDDFIAARLAAHNFHWVAVLAFTPGWASETPAQLHGAPRNPADFAAYAAAVAHRYRGSIVAYEIWNEENAAQFWRPAPDPQRYVRLYLAARAAIHRVDPGVPVLVGGLANPGAPQFVARLFGSGGLRAAVDGIAVHPYDSDPAHVLARVRNYRHELRSLGAGDVPLYVTEYGWSLLPVGNPTWAPDAQRGSFIGTVAQALLHSNCGVRLVIFYAWTTLRRNPADRDDWYGVAARDAAPTPSTAAVASTARSLLSTHGSAAGAVLISGVRRQWTRPPAGHRTRAPGPRGGRRIGPAWGHTFRS